MTFLVFATDPEQCILIECNICKIRIFQIHQHLTQIAANIMVFNLPGIVQPDFIICLHTFCENITVKIQFFQIRKHRLRILQQAQGFTDLIDILRRMLDVVKDQICKVDIRMVINATVTVFSGQAFQIKSRNDRLSLLLDELLLLRRQFQTKLFDIIQRITDLVLDRQRDQNVCAQVRVSVRVQICGQLDMFRNVGFHHGLTERIFIIFCLTHQRLCDRRDHRIDFDLSVRINVGQFCSVQSENIDSLTVTLDVTWHLAHDRLLSVKVHGLLTGCCCQVADQVFRLMIHGKDRVAQHRTFHIQMNHDIFFFI